MPPIVQTSLTWLLLALLYLFIARAVRVIYLDLVGPRVRRQGTAPARRRRRGAPRSIAIREPEQPSVVLPLKGEVVFGRADSCQVPLLSDGYVSELHARLASKDGTWFIEDLGSTNGTYLNRVKVTGPQPVAVGDEIRIGKTVVEVRR